MNPQKNYGVLKNLLVNLLSTTHCTISRSFNEERAAMLRKNLFQQPYIEAIPQYKKANGNNRIDNFDQNDLTGLSEKALSLFKGLLKDKISYPLYSHQKEMLQKAINDNAPCVVTTGTSSGKTESFLMPLLAGILREAEDWTPIQGGMNNDNFRLTVENLRGRRSNYWGETREAAVRAIVLYPMNALVDDQLSRLRDILDSDETREFYKQSLGGNRITFCRYTGSTIGRGHLYKVGPNGNLVKNNRAQAQADNLLAQLKNADDAIKVELNKVNDRPEDESRERELKRLRDLRNFFPRTDAMSAEMLCRWEIQQHPADIMITNYSMLSAMLMRGKAFAKPDGDPDNMSDGDILEKTKKWLEGEPDKENPKRVFTIVVDELHLYRGTAGTEIAYLLRLLLARLGLSPDSPQFRILASSASLSGDEHFDPQDYLKKFFGKNVNYSIINGELETVDGEDSFTDDEKLHLSREVVERHAGYLSRQLSVPMAVEEFRKKIELTDEQLEQLFEAMESSNSENLPRCRFHWIVRNSPGVFASVQKPTADDPFRTVGTLHFDNSLLRDDKGHRIYEVLFCETCGALFIAGYKSLTGDIDSPYALVGQSPNLDALPNGYVDARITEECERNVGLFWPTPYGVVDEDVTKDTIDQGVGNNNVWVLAYLDPDTGVIHDGNNVNPQEGWIPGYFYMTGVGDDIDPRAKAMSPLCPHCGRECGPNEYLKSPIRQIRIGHDKYVQAIAKCLFAQLSGDQEDRKLLAFSDSREDAAKLAHGIQHAHWRDVLRAIMFSDGNAESPINKRLFELCDKLPHPVNIERLRKGIGDECVDLVLNGEITCTDANIQKIIDAYNNRASSSITLNTDFVVSCAERLANIGVYPFGPHLSDQLYYNDWWTRFPDVTTFAPNRNFRVLREEIAEVIYSKSMIDAESIGLGYVIIENITDNVVDEALRDQGFSAQLMTEFCQGLIRILGQSPRRISYYNGMQFPAGDYWQPNQMFNAITNRTKYQGI